MPASWELQLISAIVRGDEPPRLFEDAQKRGMRAELFGTPEARTVWARLNSHYARENNFGRIPSEESLREIFPAIDLPTPLEDFTDLCDKVRQGYVRRKSESLLEDFEQSVRENPTTALVALSQALAALQEECAQDTDVDFKKVAVSEVSDMLLAAQNSGGLTGLPWPWTYMNEATQGMHAGDFILMWALPKSLKTWVGLIIATHLFQQGYRVMVYSKEMTWPKLRDRIACILARVDYDRMKKGRLSTDEQMSLLEAISRVASVTHAGTLMFTKADRLDGGPGGPAEIRKKVLQYRPDFVMLDSSYMLEMPDTQGGALDWRNLAALTRALKQVALSTGCRILAIMQENERAALKYKGTRGTASMAFNTSAPADCDLGIHIVLNKKASELSLHLAVMRDGKGDGCTINVQPCENFDYVGTHLWNVGDDADDPKGPQALVPPGAAAQLPANTGGTGMNRFRMAHIQGAGEVHNDAQPTEEELDELSGN